MEDGGDFGDAEFVEGGEKEGVAFGFGEAVDLAEDGGDVVGVGEGLVGGRGSGDERVGEGLVELVGTDATAAVEGEVPGDADEPDAEVADGGKFALMFKDTEEDILDHVFGLGWVAEDGVGDAVEERGVGRDERGEIGLRWDGLGGDKCHVPFSFPVAARRHVCPLL